jgi:RHS repeat-associated protein
MHEAITMRFSPKSEARLFLVAFLTLICCFTASAQGVDQSMDISRPVPGVGHDYIKGLNETVNPANGSLSIKIDLPVPASRGLSLPFSLIYNSGIVHHTVVETYNGGTNVGMVMDGIQYKPTDRSINGWSDTIPYAAASSWSIDAPPQSNQQAFCDVTASYTLYDANGGSHPLGITAISPVNGGGGGGTSIGSDWCETIGYSSTGYWGANGFFGKITGGTCAGLTSTGNAPGCNSAAPPFTATDVDNTVYTFPSGYVSVGYNDSGLNPMIFPTTIEDRNGNVVQIASSHSSVGYIPIANSITDTAGRPMVSVAYQGGTNVPTSYTVGGLVYALGYTTTSAGYTPASSQIAPLPPNGNITCNANFAVSDSGKTAIQTISLPNGQEYSVDYDPTYGLVNQINYPDGGWVKYTWKLNDTLSDFLTIPGSTTGPPAFGFCNFEYQTPAVATRTVGYTAGGSAALTQTFTYSTTWNNSVNPAQWTSKTTTVLTTDNVTGKTSKTIYTYGSVPGATYAYAQNAVSPQIPVETSVATYDWGPSASSILTVAKGWMDPYAMTSEVDSYPGIGSRQTLFQFDFLDRMTQKAEYAFGQTSNYYRLTDYYYYSLSPSTSSPCQEVVWDSSGSNRLSETDAYYDGATSTCASAKGSVADVSGLPPNTHDDTSYGPTASVFRGNVTTLVKWSNKGSSPTTTFTYDKTGQRLSMTDACGNASCSDIAGTNHTTLYSYTDYPADGNSYGNSNAYLTEINRPSTNGVAHQEKFGYDYESGLLVSSSDENSQLTTYDYNDSIRRMTDRYDPASATNGSTPHTTYTYVDGTSPSVTTTDPVGVKSKVVYDGMGHAIQNVKVTDPQGADTVTTTFNGMGLTASVTNPERTYSSSTDGMTSYTYDALGRKTLQKNPSDNSTESWSYSGSTITFTDEATHSWLRTFDAFGRLTQVQEPPTVTGVVPVTTYSYNELDNLIGVSQNGGADGQRTRTFLYDSLSRLLCAANPESSTTSCPTSVTSAMPQGVLSYVYDANSNVVSRTDARNAVTDYTYDVLNRVTAKTYPSPLTATLGPTSTVNYIYDIPISGWNWIPQSTPSWSSVSQTNLIGRLSDVSVGSVGANAWTVYGYDEMGRTVLKSECLPIDCGNNHHDMHYKYDLAGRVSFFDRGLDATRNHVIPSSGYYFGGFTLGYDGANNLSSVTGDTGGTNTATNIWSGTDYFPTGQPYTVLALGRYNLKYSATPRGWVTGQVITNTATQAIWNSSTSFNTNGTVNATTDKYAGAWSYSYDALNRLWKASGPGGSTTYSVDAFGNKKAATTTSGVAPSPNYGVASSNALTATGVQYDLGTGGNLTNDGSGDSFTYDSEGRLYSVNNNVCFTYDGDGDRVAQTNCNVVNNGNGNTTGILSEYLYDIDHRLMTEVNVTTQLMNRANIYAGSMYLGEDAPDAYLTNTPTASLLRVTDQVGTLRGRWDLGSNWDGACTSFPYGDAMTCSVPPLSTALFAGKDRDSAPGPDHSGLDYFGARYYSSTMGRFMSPDWSANAAAVPYANLDNPQSLNLYAYVQNNPVSKSDPNGHCDVDGEHHRGWCIWHDLGFYQTKKGLSSGSRV